MLARVRVEGGRRVHHHNRFVDHRGGRGRMRGFRGGRDFGMVLEELAFEVLGGDLIQRAGRDLGGGNAQFLGLGENFFVLQAKFLRNVVNTNGHNFSPAADRNVP